MFLLNVCIMLSAVVIGAFGVAVIRLLLTEPRKLVFIAAAIMLLLLGMKKSSFARNLLFSIRSPKETTE